MLRELRVENLLLIERAELRLAPGLNVITGETGAGKTVLAHALDLLLGGRARPGIVRPGAGEAYVEGVFDLTGELRERFGERLPADAEEVVLARRVGADGRTRAYLGGRSATAGDLAEIGSGVLAFYGQHEHRKLTLAGAQLQILDRFCGDGHEEVLRRCAQAFAHARALERTLGELTELSAQRERELDLLDFELAEIDALDPQESEHMRLLAVRDRLRRLDALLAASGAAAEALAPDGGEAPGAAALLAGALARLDTLAGVDGALDALAERLRSLVIESRDLAGELRGYGEQAALVDIPQLREGEHDERGGPAGLQAVEERLAALERLARKHGGSVAAVLEFAARARERRQLLAGAEVACEQAAEDLAKARAALERLALELRSRRQAASRPFADAVVAQLSQLAMAEASFEVVLGERETGPSGADAVEFLIAPNPGVPPGPLREIASGGELSRVMLAIMGAGSASAEDATLIFDEVDAGIGGHTARAVGARLRDIASRRQVLCITHLPQIASLGDRHFSIVKDTAAEPTRTVVLQLGEPEVVAELVRMLGADSDDGTARRHARELRRAA
jgi:DNA repair protein RecN (Recombination protein N)